MQTFTWALLEASRNFVIMLDQFAMRSRTIDAKSWNASPRTKMRSPKYAPLGRIPLNFAAIPPTMFSIHWLGAALFHFERERIAELRVPGDLAELDALLLRNRDNNRM